MKLVKITENTPTTGRLKFKQWEHNENHWCGGILGVISAIADSLEVDPDFGASCFSYSLLFQPQLWELKSWATG